MQTKKPSSTIAPTVFSPHRRASIHRMKDRYRSQLLNQDTQQETEQETENNLHSCEPSQAPESQARDDRAQREQNREKRKKGEVITQMFVDDSIWPTKNAAAMQKGIRLTETFCEFHKIFIHKHKSEYITVNAGESQVRWKPQQDSKDSTQDEDGPPSKKQRQQKRQTEH